jgi:hypothetical protein
MVTHTHTTPDAAAVARLSFASEFRMGKKREEKE